MQKEQLKILVLYPYPLEPDGQSLQGWYLVKGLRELGIDARSCNRSDDLQKLWTLQSFKPDVVIGVGYWGNTPELVLSPMNHNFIPIPWFNADGWVANYHQILNTLPLLVTTSNWVKQTYIRDGLDGKNIQVCPIGLDPDIFYPREKNDTEILQLRKMLGVREHEKVIFTAGGDVTSKGAQEMLKAIAHFNDEFSDWKYILKVYDSSSAEDHGTEEERLIEDLGLDSNRIIYLRGAYSPEFMGALLNACDVYAAPSRLEGFGMIQVEAMACGKPVVSINVGGPQDTIIHDKTGFLVDIESEVKLDREWAYTWMGFEADHMVIFDQPKTFAYRGNVQQLADYTLRLLKDDELREKMGKNAAEHALQNFHYKVVAEKMLRLIEYKVLHKQ